MADLDVIKYGWWRSGPSRGVIEDNHSFLPSRNLPGPAACGKPRHCHLQVWIDFGRSDFVFSFFPSFFLEQRGNQVQEILHGESTSLIYVINTLRSVR